MPDEPFENPVLPDPGADPGEPGPSARLPTRVIVRRAGRIVLLDPTNRVLLSHDAWNGNDWWSTPGGGIEEGEDAPTAALREVAEETGFRDVELGPLVMRNHWRDIFYDYVLDQDEWIYLGRTAGGEPDTSGRQGLELEFMLGFTWWTVDELKATTDTVYPAQLAELLTEILASGPPTEPYVGEIDLVGPMADGPPAPRDLEGGPAPRD